MEVGHEALWRVIFHLDVHYRGYRAEFGECGSVEDTLVQGREIDYQKLDLDGPSRLGFPRGDYEFHDALSFGYGLVEAL